MWFLFSLCTVLCWGGADLFYKLGAPSDERSSHLKTVVAVGLVMGCHAIGYILIKDVDFSFSELVRYLPVSAMYILSMALGYFGLRWLELSVASPVQNASGALTAILCCVFFVQKLSLPEIAGVVAVCVGVLLLAVLEKRRETSLRQTLGEEYDAKHTIGAIAILFPIGYCVLDCLGTFMDAVYLGEADTAARFNFVAKLLSDFRVMDEDVALVAYELTFLICGLLTLCYLVFIKKEPLKLPRKPVRLCAAVLETAGQFFYVYAMSGKAVIAAPLVASYSIVSVLLSRIFLGERLGKARAAVVALVMVGIAVLGFFDA